MVIKAFRAWDEHSICTFSCLHGHKSIELHAIYARLKHPSFSLQCRGISGLGCVSLISLTSFMIVCAHVSICIHVCIYCTLYYNKVNQLYDRYSCVRSKGNNLLVITTHLLVLPRLPAICGRTPIGNICSERTL